MKIAIAFVLGIGAGVAFVVAFRAPSDVSQPETVATMVAADEEPNPSNQALSQRIAELESQIDALELEGQVAGASAPPPSEVQPEARNANSGVNLLPSQRTARQLIDGGFTPERAEWIARRYDDLERALLLPETLERDPMYLLRLEVGDAEFERYLIATGRDPVVYITRPQPNSQAALLGFQHNDRITSYDGHRVFDHREIRQLDSEGAVGSTVIVEIIRDGLPMQIHIQRGSFDAPLFPAFSPLPSR